VTVYYEINQRLADVHYDSIRYWSTEKSDNIKLMQFADRVWVETGNKIMYTKYRFAWPPVPVDKEEFMWIKLKSKEIK